MSSFPVIWTALMMQQTAIPRVVLLLPSWELKMHWVFAGFSSFNALTIMSKHSKGNAFSSRNGSRTIFMSSKFKLLKIWLKPFTVPDEIKNRVNYMQSISLRISKIKKKLNEVKNQYHRRTEDLRSRIVRVNLGSMSQGPPPKQLHLRPLN